MILKSKCYSSLDIRYDGTVAWIRFDRPDRHNTATAQMVEEMHQALTEISSLPDIVVVVLTGNGSSFCPGADLDREAGAPPSVPTRESFGSAALLIEMPQVTVAAINGGCAGAGLAWALACDLRVSAERARFALGFLDVDVAGELGAAWTLTRHVGAARARELFFLPRTMSAREMETLGLVSEVYSDATWESDIAGLVAGLAGRSPAALLGAKANLVEAESSGLHRYLELETARHLAQFDDDNAAATFAAFAARRDDLRNRS